MGHRPRFRAPVRLAAVAMMLLTSLALPACTRAHFEYQVSNREYTLENVVDVASSAKSPSFKGRPTSDAEELRHDQLVELRSKGGEAEKLATFLTSTFPNESRSVPYFAEEATVDGHPAWVVVEVWGRTDGSLDETRLWVFDRETGAVLLATSSR